MVSSGGRRKNAAGSQFGEYEVGTHLSMSEGKRGRKGSCSLVRTRSRAPIREWGRKRGRGEIAASSQFGEYEVGGHLSMSTAVPSCDYPCESVSRQRPVR